MQHFYSNSIMVIMVISCHAINIYHVYWVYAKKVDVRIKFIEHTISQISLQSNLVSKNQIIILLIICYCATLLHQIVSYCATQYQKQHSNNNYHLYSISFRDLVIICHTATQLTFWLQHCCMLFLLCNLLSKKTVAPREKIDQFKSHTQKSIKNFNFLLNS